MTRLIKTANSTIIGTIIILFGRMMNFCIISIDIDTISKNKRKQGMNNLLFFAKENISKILCSTKSDDHY